MTVPIRRPLYARTAPAAPSVEVSGARLLAVERADPAALLVTPEQPDTEAGLTRRRQLGTGPGDHQAHEQDEQVVS